MNPKKNNSSSFNRRKIHCFLMIIGAVALVGNEYYFGFINQIKYEALDKAKHFEAGRLIATISFLFSYSGILFRIFLSKNEKLGKAILWLPTLIFFAITASMVVVFFFAVGKEAIDSTGFGNVEWADVTATIEGAASMAYSVAILMALTPMLIPLELTLQIPNMIKKDFLSGHKKIDNYVSAQNKHPKLRGNADVLLVEDDIVCSANVLDFCTLLKLTCHHTDTIKEAEAYIELQLNTMKLLILDIFVRVDQEEDRRNGMDFLKELNTKFPKETRKFKIVMMSGHTHMIGDLEVMADLVLQKPWNPLELKKKLMEWKIINS